MRLHHQASAQDARLGGGRTAKFLQVVNLASREQSFKRPSSEVDEVVRLTKLPEKPAPDDIDVAIIFDKAAGADEAAC